MRPFLLETAAYYGAPLSVLPSCHHDFQSFIRLVLDEGDGRLKNLLPFLLVKRMQDEEGISQEYSKAAARQVTQTAWTEEDRNQWRDVCRKVLEVGIDPQRALQQLRRFLKPAA
jgi:hypothetical protein